MTKPHDCIVKLDENGKYRYVVINGKYYPAEDIEEIKQLPVKEHDED